MTGAGPAPPERPTAIGERKITVDLDNADPFDLYRAWSVLADAGAYDIEGRVSASGEGCHVRGWVGADDVDEAGVEALRLSAGDHPRRTQMDREHAAKPPQILFGSKPGGRAGPWHSNPFDAARELRARSHRYGIDSWGPL